MYGFTRATYEKNYISELPLYIMAKNRDELIRKIQNQLRTLGGKYRDYDYSNPKEIKQARIEITSRDDLVEKLVKELNQKMSLEAGYIAQLRTI